MTTKLVKYLYASLMISTFNAGTVYSQGVVSQRGSDHFLAQSTDEIEHSRNHSLIRVEKFSGEITFNDREIGVGETLSGTGTLRAVGSKNWVELVSSNGDRIRIENGAAILHLDDIKACNVKNAKDFGALATNSHIFRIELIHGHLVVHRPSVNNAFDSDPMSQAVPMYSSNSIVINTQQAQFYMNVDKVGSRVYACTGHLEAQPHVKLMSTRLEWNPLSINEGYSVELNTMQNLPTLGTQPSWLTKQLLNRLEGFWGNRCVL